MSRSSPRQRPGRTSGRLRAAFAGTGVRLRVTHCLDAYEHADVAIVGSSAAGRNVGGRPVRLGEVLDSEPIEEISGWATSGGPGVAPGTLDSHTSNRSRRVREQEEGTG